MFESEPLGLAASVTAPLPSAYLNTILSESSSPFIVAGSAK